MIDVEDLANRFAYHQPKDADTGMTHATVRQICFDAARDLNALIPDGREKSLAITHLEEVMMWANAAVARA